MNTEEFLLYTPIRANECYFDDGEIVEIINRKGTFRIKGGARIIWKMLDGCKTIKDIFNIVKKDRCKNFICG